MTKVHYKGREEDFIVFVDSAEDLEKWKGDRSIPLANVVNSFKIFVTHKYGGIDKLRTTSMMLTSD